MPPLMPLGWHGADNASHLTFNRSFPHLAAQQGARPRLVGPGGGATRVARPRPGLPESVRGLMYIYVYIYSRLWRYIHIIYIKNNRMLACRYTVKTNNPCKIKTPSKSRWPPDQISLDSESLSTVVAAKHAVQRTPQPPLPSRHVSIDGESA
jgi:hypothetical protein